MRQRFRVRKVCLVADRGMISAKTTAALEAGDLDCDYILGARMRSVKEKGAAEMDVGTGNVKRHAGGYVWETQIGGSASARIGFWGATPVVQP